MMALNKFYTTCLLGVAALWLTGCSNTKYLQPGQNLYIGADIHIITDEKIPEEAALKRELENVIRPAPNNTVLGLRAGLWVYNISGEPRKEKGGFRRWARKNLGEAPVLFSDVSPESNLRLIINRLENNGYFDPEVEYELALKKRKAHIHYMVKLNQPYRINRVLFPGGDDELETRIRAISGESLLKPGIPYKLDMLVEERQRIDAHLKEAGYFYFNPNYIIFRVDSSEGYRQVNIYADVKRDIPDNARKIYIFRNIFVNTDYNLGTNGAAKTAMDTLELDGLFILSHDQGLKPSVFQRTIFLRRGDRYSRRNHETTLGHLMGLGIYQFVNIRFNEVEGQDGKAYLDAFINLTPAEKRSLRLELRAVSKSNNFAGPGFNINYRNRNIFRGAEIFIVNLRSSYETVISGIQRGLNSYEVGGTGEIQLPRFIAPFNVNPHRPIRNIPKTRILVGYSLLNRVDFFFMNSFNTTFGYLWSETLSKRHELNPFAINYVRLGNTTPRFDSILDRNPVLRRSFEEQLIIGSNYTFTFNDQLKEQRIHNFFFMGNLDVAGNLIYLLQSIITRNFATEESPHTVIGRPYAQYTRGEADFRHYYRPSPKTRIVSRFLIGTGFAYANTNTLPYVKQFFIGGANSIRAFPPRSLGPGTFEPVIPEDGQVFFLDQIGDIKIEANVEYRFPIISLLKGAVFFDSGNIWNYRPNPTLAHPETGAVQGTFLPNHFYKEIAVGTGAGIRLDANFFVLRFDLGIPLRKPWLEPGNRWVLDEINFGNPKWRGRNLVLNIAIGYPF